MMRKLLLTLAEDANDVHCGACRFNVRDHSNHVERYCMAFEIQLVSVFGTPCERSTECIAAEREAARLVDIAPEDIAASGWDVWAPHGYDEAANRVANALAEHAKKAGG